MKTEKALTQKLPRQKRLPKSAETASKRFRHRDRGIHLGRTKGS